MKTFKTYQLLLIAVLAMCFTACSDDDKEKFEPVVLSGTQAFFPNTQPSTVTLSKTANSFDVTLGRATTEGAVTVELDVTDASGKFTIPSSASFTDGSETTIVTIGYNPDELEYDEYAEITLSIRDANSTTPYGNTSYTFKAGIPAPWVSLGTATFIEDFLTTFYDVENIPYQVEIQENELQPGYFRLVNAFGEAYPYNDPGDWDATQDWYLEIHAEDPDGVYISTQATGMTWSYGMFYVGSLAGYYLAKGQSLEDVKSAGLTGTYKDGIISFPKETLLVGMADYNNGGMYIANSKGAFKVVMPGVVLADYSIGVAYAGKYMGTDDQIAGVMAQITEVGEDVQSVRLAVVEGTDVDAAVEGIKDGSVSFTEASAETANVLLPFESEPVEGRYTIVAVSYANGEAQEVASSTFKFVPLSGGVESWTARYVGDYTYTLLFGSEEEPSVDEELVLYQSDSDANRWKIEHWGYDVDFVFTFDQETGEILVADQETGATHSNYGTIYIDDLVDYTGTAERGYSYFDAESMTFHFAVIYYVEAGNFGYGYETFSLTGYAPAKASQAAPARQMKIRKPVIGERNFGKPHFMRKISGQPFLN